jgi:hypothetical protein
MQRTRLVSVLAALAISAAACSSSGSTATPGSGVQNSAEPGSSELAVSAPSFASAGGGSCGVQIDGDVTKAWHTDQTKGTLLVSYWLSPDDRSLNGVEDGQEMLDINCQSDQGSISLITTAGTMATQFPKAPGKYVIEAGGLVADRKPGEIQTVTNLKDKSLWKVIENGTLEITGFTPTHFVGSFTFKIGKSGDDLKTIVATATVSGTFDLGCTGSACS